MPRVRPKSATILVDRQCDRAAVQTRAQADQWPAPAAQPSSRRVASIADHSSIKSAGDTRLEGRNASVPAGAPARCCCGIEYPTRRQSEDALDICHVADIVPMAKDLKEADRVDLDRFRGSGQRDFFSLRSASFGSSPGSTSASLRDDPRKPAAGGRGSRNDDIDVTVQPVREARAELPESVRKPRGIRGIHELAGRDANTASVVYLPFEKDLKTSVRLVSRRGYWIVEQPGAEIMDEAWLSTP